jgi:ADP-ribose pyrophosphatase
MQAFEIRDEHVVFDGFLKVVEAEVRYERRDGHLSLPVRRLKLERGDSVAAVIVDRERGVALFTRQFRYPAAGFLLELAAGTKPADETPEACMRRELEEELGYRVTALLPINTFFVSPGGSSERIHLFYAEASAATKVGAGGGIGDEDIEIVAKPLAEIPALLTSGEIADAKTLIGLNWLVATGQT